jgi:hypothetical protein
MLEAIKLIKNDCPSIFLIANAASWGILGESLIMFKAASLTESTIASNSFWFFFSI